MLCIEPYSHHRIGAVFVEGYIYNYSCNTMTTEITSTEILLREDDKLLGRLEYRLQDGQMIILHTYAYEAGRGIGSMLMSEAVEWAHRHSNSIVPVCSFAKKYLNID